MPKKQLKDIKQCWDIGKLHVQSITKNYSHQKNIKNRETLSLAEKILAFEQNQSQSNSTRMKEARETIQRFEHEKNKGIFVRSRTQFYEEYEKPTRYFYNLENKNKKSTTITELVSANGDIITSQEEILQESHHFYQNLYTKEPTCSKSQEKLLKNLNRKLSSTQKARLDKDFSKEELFSALLKLKAKKSPGIDGLPMEFYVIFWPIIGDEFTELVKSCQSDLVMSKSMQTAVLALLYKKGDKKDLNNWRPISLLCADYKIIAKALSMRLQKLLHVLVSPDQTCGIPSRNIYSNLRLTRDVMRYARDKGIQAILVNLDQEKAFDRVDHGFLDKVLQTMNIGPVFRRWIKTFYTGICCIIKNNGNLSQPVWVQRGVRQGCPLSPLLYVLVAETFGQAIRIDKEIKGVKIPGCKREVRISQYADDTTLFLTTSASINRVNNIIEIYQKASNAKLNIAKSKMMRFGRVVLNGGMFDIPHLTFEISVKILGITFFNDFYHMQNFNWRIKLQKLENILNMWKVRQLSLKGKAEIVNTLALSTLWYTGTIIKPLKQDLKQIRSLIFRFIWGGGMEQIKRHTLYLPIRKGGLGIQNPMRQMQAMDLRDVKYITNEECDYLWVYLARYWIGRQLGTCHLDWRFLSHNNSQPHSANYPFFYGNFVKFAPKDISVFLQYPLATKDIYVFLQNLFYNKKHSVSGQTLFTITGQEEWNRETTVYIPWSQGWRLSYQGYNSFSIQDCTFKLRHHTHLTNFRAHLKFIGLKKLYSNNHLCPICKQTETALHAFANCNIPNRIWRFFLPYIADILPANTPLHQPLLMLGIFVNKGEAKLDFPYRLAFTITTTIVDRIWKNRQNYYANKNKISFTETKRSICSTIVNLINHKFTFHTANSTLKEFKARFAINNSLCTVNKTGQLIHHLPTR